MTREERRKWFCQRCGGCVDNGEAKYKCPPLNDDMYAWEVGYKDAVDKASKWLIDNLPLYFGQINADNTDRFVRIFRKAMEEQQ